MLVSANLIPMAAAAIIQVAPAFETISSNISVVERRGEASHGDNTAKKRTIHDQLEYVGSLPAGWNGDVASPISKAIIGEVKSAIDYVRGLAPFGHDPAIVPCADGSLQLEWYLPDGQFEMYFETDGSVGAWWHDNSSSEEFENEGEAAFDLLAHWAVRDAAWTIAA